MIKCKSVLIISHEMSRTGAPIMVFQATKALAAAGFIVSVLTYKDGPLKEDFVKENIKVLKIYSPLNEKSELLHLYARTFDLVIINTSVCTGAVKTFINQDLPVLWWIHEGTIPQYLLKDIPEKLSPNFHVICVSNYAKKLLSQFGITNKADVLYNGVKDSPNTEHKVKNYKQFICVGSIEERKGQDLILKAIDKLNNNGVNDLEFIFVGNALSSKIKEGIDSYCKKYQFIKQSPIMPHEEVLKLIASATAVLVPSRDDAAPLVACEAFMLKKPVIVSDHTGQADLITDGKNGFVIKNEDFDSLAEKILWIRNNPQKAEEIGINGREIYNKYFSCEKFNHNFVTISGRLINKTTTSVATREQLISDSLNELFQTASTLNNLIFQELEAKSQLCLKQEQQINNLMAANSAIQNSKSYRIGRMLTWIPRKVRNCLTKRTNTLN